jgi:CheY-like chemotaxis protein
MEVYKILVAEDEAGLRELYCEFLREDGYEVVEAEDGQAAIDLMKVQDFDLLISDFRMPRVNGVENPKSIFRLSLSLRV